MSDELIDELVKDYNPNFDPEKWFEEEKERRKAVKFVNDSCCMTFDRLWNKYRNITEKEINSLIKNILGVDLSD